jgi:DNA-binding MarR family transcriptional regulator
MLKRVSQAFERNGLDITSDEWVVLVRLSAKAGLSQTEISEMIVRDKSRMTRIITSLRIAWPDTTP